MRVAVASLGFFGMIAHFSQKTNVSIGLVCMVNHSAIERYHINRTKAQTIPMNDDCPQKNNTNHIVNKLNRQTIHSYLLLIGRSFHLVKKYSRSHSRCLFLGIYYKSNPSWIFSWSIWC